MTPQTFSSQYISIASPSLLLSLYELQLFESLSTRLPLPSLFFSASAFVCNGTDGLVGCVEWTGTHMGHLPDAIGGQSMRDDFGGNNASYIVCTIQVQMETVWVRHKLDCSFLLQSSPLRSPRISQGPAFGITIDITNNKLLQVSDNFLCDWELCTTCC